MTLNNAMLGLFALVMFAAAAHVALVPKTSPSFEAYSYQTRPSTR